MAKPEKNPSCVHTARHLLDEPGPLGDDLPAGGSHDLRTALAVLGWSLNNLLDGLAGEVNKRQREYLKAMDRAVRKLDGLVSSGQAGNRLEETAPINSADSSGNEMVRALGMEREQTNGTERHGSDSG